MTNLNNNAAVPPRTTVRIPTASGDELEAWLYLPEEAGPHPAVVMAHGIGGIKAGGLAPSPSASVRKASSPSPSTTATSAVPAESRAKCSPSRASALVGYLNGMSPDDSIEALADFRRRPGGNRLNRGSNLAIEYRWLEGRYDQIPTMLADLVKQFLMLHPGRCTGRLLHAAGIALSVD